MAQQALFQIPSRASKKDDISKIKSTRNRKKVNTEKRVTGDNLRDALVRAKSMSERILGDKLKNLELVTDIEELWKYAKKSAVRKRVALDTETGGLNTMHDPVAGVCLYAPGQKGIYIPTGHISNMTKAPIADQISKKQMAEVLEYLVDMNVKFIYHNAKFDLKVVYWQYNVDLGIPFWDTGVASSMLNENEPHSLKFQHVKYVDGDEDKETAKFNKLFSGMPFPIIDPKVGYMYAAYDPVMTYELYKFQKPYLTKGTPQNKKSKLEGVANVFHKIEMPLIKVLMEMEIRGVSIDLGKLSEIKDFYEDKYKQAINDFNETIEEYREDIERWGDRYPNDYEKLSDPVNPNSPAQIAIILYDVFKLKSNDRRKPRGTGDDIISDMKHPIVDALKRCRKYSKLISTYLNMDEKVSPRTGRVHSNYNQNGPKTGRLSSDAPNMQNIPARGEGKEIRLIFTARKGFVLVGSDYSQQEPRILAEASEDQNLINAYLQGKDLYMTMAAAVYHNNYEDNAEFFPNGKKNPEGYKRRNSVKEILLGIIYGRQAPSIAEKLNISTKEAEDIMASVLKAYPGIGNYMLEMQEHAVKYGYVSTLAGRKRRLPDMQLPEYDVIYEDQVDLYKAGKYDQIDLVPDEEYEKYFNMMMKARRWADKNEIKDKAERNGYAIMDNTMKIAEAERQTLNSIIQGTAADMSKLAMIRVHYDKRMKEIDFHLLIPVHDELIGEAPREHAEEAAQRLSDIMIECAREIVSIPMKCDAEITERWTGESVIPA